MSWAPVDTNYYPKLLTEQGNFLITESGAYITIETATSPSWTSINNSQSAGWGQIDTTQTPNWTNIPTY